MRTIVKNVVLATITITVIGDDNLTASEQEEIQDALTDADIDDDICDLEDAFCFNVPDKFKGRYKLGHSRYF